MIYLALAQTVTSDSPSDGDWSLIGLAFFLSGFIFYGVMYVRYRNIDKRFKHESSTRADMSNVQSRDERVRQLRGLSNSTMQGANSRQVSGSLNSVSKILGSGGAQQIMNEVNRFFPGNNK